MSKGIASTFGRSAGAGRALGSDRAAVAETSALCERRTVAALGPQVPGRDRLRLAARDRLGTPSVGTGLRFGHDLLVTASGVAGGRRLAAASRGDARQAKQCGTAGFLAGHDRRSDRESSELHPKKRTRTRRTGGCAAPSSIC